MSVTSVSIGAIYARECQAEFRKAWRMPEFSLPTILLPLGFYSLFALALGQAGGRGPQLPLLATFGVYAALGPAIFGFGVGMANERQQGLLELKRVSPMPAQAIVAAKLIMCMVFAFAVVVALHGLATLAGGVRLPFLTQLGLAAIQTVSVVPFACIGLLLGLALRDQAAMAAANVAFFLLAVLGGLWMPMAAFPGWLQHFALLLPSYHAGELALHAVGLGDRYPASLHAIVALGETALFAAAALWAWRRQLASV
ncbi:ABC transporter permease [Roseiterribacter gracilis]|uniref:ABC transporter n=1 Tax=Roseiterribacter gracilis TaxID=2812848 RepID=A0A8S8XIA9_9PROT|nr:ABC transporter [Rhodospirillales bacterium TMPK1]